MVQNCPAVEQTFAVPADQDRRRLSPRPPRALARRVAIAEFSTDGPLMDKDSSRKASMNDTGAGRGPWRSVHPVATLCTAGAIVLKATPVLASDPAGMLSGLYAFSLVVPWVALNLVLAVVIAIKGGYRSVVSAKRHAAVGAALPLIGLGVVAFDYLAVRRPSTPWPGVETILISCGLCILGLLACLLAPLFVYRRTTRQSD